jgi:hypothetical protein
LFRDNIATSSFAYQKIKSFFRESYEKMQKRPDFLNFIEYKPYEPEKSILDLNLEELEEKIQMDISSDESVKIMMEPAEEILYIKTLKNKKMLYYSKNDKNLVKLPGKIAKTRCSRKKK